MTSPTPPPEPDPAPVKRVRPDRSFPMRCPECNVILALDAKTHCGGKDNHACDWLRCKCRAVITQAGTWFNGDRRGGTP